jgi:predicted nucleic acid-binding protein
VLDSFSLLAFFFGEEGKAAVSDWLHEANRGGHELLLCTVNWAELGYITVRKCGPAKWEFVRQALDQLPVRVVDADRHLAAGAVELKAAGGLSLADAFAAALAQRERAVLLTGDPEFRALGKAIEIVWIISPRPRSDRMRPA